jgi:hypothetical protein
MYTGMKSILDRRRKDTALAESGFINNDISKYGTFQELNTI